MDGLSAVPIYCLRPVVALLEDPAWRNSPYSGPVWANAADEGEARALASGRFQDARADIPGVSGGASPWQDTRLVAAKEEAAPDGMSIPIGVVVGEKQM